MPYAPIVFLSALTKKIVPLSKFSLIYEIDENMERRLIVINDKETCLQLYYDFKEFVKKARFFSFAFVL